MVKQEHCRSKILTEGDKRRKMFQATARSGTMFNSFYHAESVEEEMNRLKTYPEAYVKQLVSQGQTLASLAAQGQLKQIKVFLSTLREVTNYLLSLVFITRSHLRCVTYLIPGRASSMGEHRDVSKRIQTRPDPCAGVYG